MRRKAFECFRLWRIRMFGRTIRKRAAALVRERPNSRTLELPNGCSP